MDCPSCHRLIDDINTLASTATFGDAGSTIVDGCRKCCREAEIAEARMRLEDGDVEGAISALALHYSGGLEYLWDTFVRLSREDVLKIERCIAAPKCRK